MPRDRRPLLWPVVLCASWLVACDDSADPPSPKPDVPAAAPVSDPPVAAVAVPGLDAALARGIVAPTQDDGTYRVDPFVAVVVYERLRADLEPFVWVDAKGSAPAGFQVGPLQPADALSQLGLQRGDIVEALNGLPLQTSAQRELALDAAENRLTVTIYREDLSFTNSYRFDGGLAWRDVIGGPVAESGEEQPPAEPSPPDADVPSQPAPAARASPGKKRDGATRPARTPNRPTTRPPVPKSSDIRCSSGSACTVTKRTFDDLRSSPSRLQKGVDIVPAIRNDVFSGYKLKRVTSGSPVHQLGFRSGDKITHINGRDLTDDAQAMALYWSLGSSKVFKIRYERGGRKQVKTVRVV